MTLDIRHDTAARRFVATTQGQEAYLSYAPAGPGRLDYEYTFVPPEQRGRGLGEEIVKYALQYAREQGYRVIPSCGFVRRVVHSSDEYRDLVD